MEYALHVGTAPAVPAQESETITDWPDKVLSSVDAALHGGPPPLPKSSVESTPPHFGPLYLD